MNTAEAIVYGTIISGLFGIAGLMFLNMNWFKRENFKILRDAKRKEIDINFKKMQRDLGLNVKNPPSSVSSPTLGGGGLDLKALIPLLKSLSPETVQDLIGVATGGDDSDTPASPLDGLLQFASQNPELVQGFVDRLKTNQNTPQIGGEGAL